MQKEQVKSLILLRKICNKNEYKYAVTHHFNKLDCVLELLNEIGWLMNHFENTDDSIDLSDYLDTEEIRA